MGVWRKTAAALMSALVLMGAAGTLADADVFAEDRLVYRDLGDGTCEVAGVSEEGKRWETIEIPQAVHGGQLEVVRIAAGAFEDDNLIRTLAIPDTVSGIGAAAFRHCDNLRNVVMPDYLNMLGEEAFCMCGQLLEISIPAGLTEIPEGAFFACDALKKIEVPEGVRCLADRAFASCRELESAALPSTLEAIGSACFEACASLRTINMPSAVHSLGDAVFADCMRLAEMQLPEGLEEVGEAAFDGCAALTSFALPESVQRIGAKAFRSCVRLSEFAIYGTVRSVGDEAFAYSTSLTDAVFPEGLLRLGNSAFEGVAVQVSLPQSLLSIGSNVFTEDGCTVDFAGSPAMWESVLIGSGNDGISEVRYGREDGPGSGLAAQEGSGLSVADLSGTSVAAVFGLEAGAQAPRAATLYEGITAQGGSLEVLSAGGERVAPEDGVGTGCIVQGAGPEGEFLGRAHVIVRGDLLGTGVMNVGQLVAVAQALTGLRALTPLELAAIDLNDSGGVDIADLAREAQMLLGVQ